MDIFSVGTSSETMQSIEVIDNKATFNNIRNFTEYEAQLKSNDNSYFYLNPYPSSILDANQTIKTPPFEKQMDVNWLKYPNYSAKKYYDNFHAVIDENRNNGHVTNYDTIFNPHYGLSTGTNTLHSVFLLKDNRCAFIYERLLYGAGSNDYVYDIQIWDSDPITGLTGSFSDFYVFADPPLDYDEDRLNINGLSENYAFMMPDGNIYLQLRTENNVKSYPALAALINPYDQTYNLTNECFQLDIYTGNVHTMLQNGFILRETEIYDLLNGNAESIYPPEFGFRPYSFPKLLSNGNIIAFPRYGTHYALLTSYIIINPITKEYTIYEIPGITTDNHASGQIVLLDDNTILSTIKTTNGYTLIHLEDNTFEYISSPDKSATKSILLPDGRLYMMRRYFQLDTTFANFYNPLTGISTPSSIGISTDSDMVMPLPNGALLWYVSDPHSYGFPIWQTLYASDGNYGTLPDFETYFSNWMTTQSRCYGQG